MTAAEEIILRYKTAVSDGSSKAEIETVKSEYKQHYRTYMLSTIEETELADLMPYEK
jgi:hypothetical protein